ncbi:MAG TPA: MFS transporter, partial [Thermomicrobiales bacterium]|nr:MFS transporter [Thermomicrobiales bacterium]
RRLILRCSGATMRHTMHDARRRLRLGARSRLDGLHPMGSYLLRVRGFSRDIHLFLLYNLLAYVGFGVFILIYNLYLIQLGLREDYIGAFNAVLTLSTAGAAATMGPVLRRYGVWRCMVGGLVLFLAVSIALALVTVPAVLLVLGSLFGIALAYISTVTMPFIIEWGRVDRRAEIAAMTFSLISLATTLGSLLGGFAPTLISAPIPSIEPGSLAAYRWTLIAGSLVALTALIPVVRMGEARRRPARDAKRDGREEEESPAEQRQARRDVWVFVAVGGLMAIGVGMVGPFYNVYLASLGASARQIGYIYAIAGLSAAVVGLAAPSLAARMGTLQAVLLVRLSVVPFFVLLIVSPGIGIAVLAQLVRATSISMAWPLDSTFIAEVLPARYRASVFGLRSAAWNLTFSGASLLAGWVIVRAGYTWPFLSLIVFSTASVVLFVVYFRRHPRVRAGEIPSTLGSRQRERRQEEGRGGGEELAGARRAVPGVRPERPRP